MKTRLLIAAALSAALAALAMGLTLAWNHPDQREITLRHQVTALRSQATDDLYFTNRPAWEQLDDQRHQTEVMAQVRTEQRQDAVRATDAVFLYAGLLAIALLIAGLIWPPLTPAAPATSPRNATPSPPDPAR